MKNLRLFIDDKEYATNCLIVAFSKILNGVLSENDQIVKDVNGIDRSFGHGDTSYENLICTAPSGDDGRGIVVGKGSKAVNKEDYQLDDKIVHGTGTNELLYDNQIFVEYVKPNTTDGYLEIELSRSFSNNSGSNITIYEVGLITGASTYRYLNARDLIAGGHTVNNNSSCVVKYLIRIEI